MRTVFLSDDFVKLGDFGLSKDMGTAAFTSTYVGVSLHMHETAIS
jgi:NIMA (never in mitosis gene a)-related kinase